MNIELGHWIIIGLLLLILAGVTAVAIVESQIKEKLNDRTGAQQQALTTLDAASEELLRRIENTLLEVLREFKPADGASISYRVNSLVTSGIEDAKNWVYVRAAQQEAVQGLRAGVENSGRILVGIATILEKLDALAIALASQGREQSKISTYVQTYRDNNTANLQESTVGQLGAGAGTTQATERSTVLPPLPPLAPLAKTVVEAQKGVDTAQKGVDAAQAGIADTQKGIDETQRSINKAKESGEKEKGETE